MRLALRAFALVLLGVGIARAGIIMGGPGFVSAPVWHCNTTDGNTGGSTSITVGSEANRKLVVFIAARGDSTTCPGDAAPPPSGAPAATLDGGGLTYIESGKGYINTTSSSTGRVCLSTMYLDDPTPGVHTLAYQVSNTASTSPLSSCVMAVVVGSAETGGLASGEMQIQTSGGGTATETSLGSLTMSTDSVMLTALAKRDDMTAPTLGADATLVTGAADAGDGSLSIRLSTESYPSGGTDTGYFGWSTGARFVAAALELDPR